MPRRAARIDATAPMLVKAARDMGFIYIALNGVVDGLLQRGGKTWIVDWKSPGGTLTDAQAKLVAAGARIEFISTVDQLRSLLEAA